MELMGRQVRQDCVKTVVVMGRVPACGSTYSSFSQDEVQFRVFLHWQAACVHGRPSCSLTIRSTSFQSLFPGTYADSQKSTQRLTNLVDDVGYARTPVCMIDKTNGERPEIDGVEDI